jgi:hypothetical protein
MIDSVKGACGSTNSNVLVVLLAAAVAPVLKLLLGWLALPAVLLLPLPVPGVLVSSAVLEGLLLVLLVLRSVLEVDLRQRLRKLPLLLVLLLG